MKSKTKNNTSEPIRINKYLSNKGISTRKGADELIKNGKVFINGRIAVLGDKVNISDSVEIKDKIKKNNYVYLAYNKPKGVVSTNPQNDEKSIMNTIKLNKKYTQKNIFPVGRIDKESHGLMILTNDGRITDRLLNPKYNHEKEYIVKVDRKFSPSFVKHLENGVDIGDGITKPAKIKKITEDTFSITLTEGKNRQIKRMTEKLGYTVRDLKRTRIQNIYLNKIPPGEYEEIKNDDKEVFLKNLGLEQ